MTEGAGKEGGEQSIGVIEGMFAPHAPDALDGLPLVPGRTSTELGDLGTEGRPDAGMFRWFELGDGEVAKEEFMGGGRPGCVEGALDIEPVARNAGTGERHGTALSGVVGDRGE
jgi:hypothetical protein